MVGCKVQTREILVYTPTAALKCLKIITGGVAKLDISKSGNIIAVNLTGSLELVQPKDPAPKKEFSIRSRSPALVEPKSPRPTDPDPFITKLFLQPESIPSKIPTALSWAELQEQKRVAR